MSLNVGLVTALPEPEVILFKPLFHLRRFPLQLFSRFQPVATSGDSLHPILVEGDPVHIGPGNAEPFLFEKLLNFLGRMKAKDPTVRAAKDPIDDLMDGAVEGIARLDHNWV